MPGGCGLSLPRSLCFLPFGWLGGPSPYRGFKCGRGVARFPSIVLGGRVVGKARADFADHQDGE